MSVDPAGYVRRAHLLLKMSGASPCALGVDERVVDHEGRFARLEAEPGLVLVGGREAGSAPRRSCASLPDHRQRLLRSVLVEVDLSGPVEDLAAGASISALTQTMKPS